MKTKFYGLFLALCSALALTSCNNDDDDIRLSDVPNVVVDSFEAKFPNASRTEWENKNGYIIADFWQDGMETKVWYNTSGDWLMTEYDFEENLSALPQAIQNAFQASAYATWRIDNIDKYERPNDLFYLIEVETKGQADRNLYYAEDGSLLKDEVDKENDAVTPSFVF